MPGMHNVGTARRIGPNEEFMQHIQWSMEWALDSGLHKLSRNFFAGPTIDNDTITVVVEFINIHWSEWDLQQANTVRADMQQQNLNFDLAGGTSDIIVALNTNESPTSLLRWNLKIYQTKHIFTDPLSFY